GRRVGPGAIPRGGAQVVPLPQLGERRRELPLPLQDQTEVTMGLGQLGLQFRRPAERGGRLVQAALFGEYGPEVPVRRDVLGLPSDRLAEGGLGVAEPARPHQSQAEVEPDARALRPQRRSEEHTSELQSRFDLVCRLLLEKKKKKKKIF